MPFIVQCPYCKARARVPERAQGASGKCVRCASSFTLVPADDQRAPVLVGAAAGAAEPAVEQVASSAVSAAIARAVAVADSTPVDDIEPADAVDEPPPKPAVPCPRAVSPPSPKRAKVQPGTLVGAAALLIAGAALLCASVPSLCVLVRPLSGVGLLTGLAAVGMARTSSRRRQILPIASSAFPAVLLIFALFVPAFLGPTYFRSRQPGAPDPTILRAIPLASAPVIAEVPDWINASQYALHRGELRVQVAGVTAGAASKKDGAKAKAGIETPAKTTSAKPDLLLVRVRVQMPLNDQKAGGESKPFDRHENRDPALLDLAGKSFTLRDTHVQTPSEGSRRSSLFPISTADVIYTFEAPAADWESLRLEVPGAAWGGTGVFRFAIPATMLQARLPGGKATPPNNGK